MNKHINTFRWESSTTHNPPLDCQVHLRDSKVGQLVTIEGWEGNKRINGDRPFVTFRAHELQSIIDALQQAQKELAGQ